MREPDTKFSWLEWDPDIRQSLDWSHPMPKQHDEKWQGVYLFWAAYNGSSEKWDDEITFINDILPLYVGQSSVLAIRLRQHIVGKTRWGEVFHKERDLYSIKRNGIVFTPEEFPQISVWYETDARNRILLEHKAISEFNPIYNQK